MSRHPPQPTEPAMQLTSLPENLAYANASRLEVKITDHPEGLVVRVLGEASLPEIDRLRIHLMYVTVRRPRLVILDLADLVFIGSLGWGALNEFRRGIIRRGGEVRLAGMRPEIEEAFRSLSLDKLFPYYSSADEALTT